MQLFVKVYWGDALYDSRVLTEASAIHIGNHPNNTFRLETDRKSFRLLQLLQPGKAEMWFDEEMGGYLRKASGDLVPLRKLRTSEKGPVSHVPLNAPDEAEIRFDYLSFRLCWVENPAHVPRIERFKLPSTGWMLSTLMVSGLTTALLWTPFAPPSHSLDAQRIVRLLPKEEALPPTPKTSEPPEPEPKTEEELPVPVQVVKPKAPQTTRPVVKKRTPPVQKPAEITAPPEDTTRSLLQDLSSLASKDAPAPRRPERMESLTPDMPVEKIPGKTLAAAALETTEGQGKGEFSSERSRLLPTGKVSNETAQVEGGLAADDVHKVLEQGHRKLVRCYERRLREKPDLKGALTLSLIIGKSGSVEKASVPQSEMNDAAFNSCLIAEARRWRFPKPEGVARVAVDYPLSFERSEVK